MSGGHACWLIPCVRYSPMQKIQLGTGGNRPSIQLPTPSPIISSGTVLSLLLELRISSAHPPFWRKTEIRHEARCRLRHTMQHSMARMKGMRVAETEQLGSVLSAAACFFHLLLPQQIKKSLLSSSFFVPSPSKPRKPRLICYQC